MNLIWLFVALNVLLLFIFRLFKKYEIHTFQAIVFNYVTCIIVGSLTLGRFPIDQHTPSQAWFPYALILGALFISGFTLLGTSVRIFGLTITSIAQKMSLIMPILFGLIYFDESLGILKMMGILCAFLSIIFINFPNKKRNQPLEITNNPWYLIVLTFVVSGIIDILLFYVEHANLSDNADIGFVVSLFGMAALLGSIVLIIGLLTKRLKWQSRNMIAGLALGIPNFFSIYILLLIINEGYEGSVLFPILNVSIILGAAVVGAIVFRERLHKWQWTGFVLGILCILLIAYS